MNELTPQEKLKWIVQHSNREILLRMVAEECAELNKECLKAIRALKPDEYVSESFETISAHIEEEIADVYNAIMAYRMFSNMKSSIIDDISNAKICRWYDRLKYLESIKDKTQ